MKIALLGYGKMGKTIENIAIANGHEITLKVNITNATSLTKDNLQGIDIAIEFSTPNTVINHINICLDAGIPVVVGTTGWNQSIEMITKSCEEKNGAILYASNFSIGVNLFFELNRKLAKLMKNYPQYKTTITEIHHTAKLDKPSGTAISLAKDIHKWDNNSSEESTLHIESIRLPEVPGTHIISYTSDEDEIEIKHTAYNRNGFATGALLAAEWLINKKGIYTMKDVLNTI